MNNEPVAWGNQNTFCKYCHRIPSQCGCTHPVKELTDGEILEELLIPKSEWDSYKAHHCLKQIRAILRKAQEK